MAVFMTGVSHKTAPVELRERLTFSADDLPRALDTLRRGYPTQEAVILSTCNRIEVYGLVEEVQPNPSRSFLADYHSIPLHDLQDALYFLANGEAVAHLFKVASGLDSLVLGEPQILGQVKDAYAVAKDLGHTGPVLNHLFDKAFSTAKRVRTLTAIGEGSLSVSSAAVELALKIFKELGNRTVALMGAGRMAELAAQYLISRGVGRLLVVNRTHQKAQEMAQRLGGEALPSEALPDALHRADIFITSTASPDFILRKEELQAVMRHRQSSPLFLIDIAVPRDVEPSVNELEGVYLYDIDDLRRVTEVHARERLEEVKRAEEIIQEEAEKFLMWQAALRAAPAIASIRSKAEQIRRQELEKTLIKLQDLPEENKRAIRQMTIAMVNRLLHPPMMRLKEGALNGQPEADRYIKEVCYLFGLDNP